MSHSSESELAPFEYGKSFHLTQQPDPNFKPGNGGAGSKFLEDWRRKGEEAGYETIDPKTTQPRYVVYLRHRRGKMLNSLLPLMTNRDMYRLLIGGITPRPIAFVSSTAQDGTHNLAPFRCVASDYEREQGPENIEDLPFHGPATSTSSTTTRLSSSSPSRTPDQARRKTR